MYLHEVFDSWINRTYPHVKWERYADDIIIPPLGFCAWAFGGVLA
jgi:hypothetical protein